MPHRIHRDHQRFQEIVRGKIKQDFQKYLKNKDAIFKNRKGGKIRIPMPQIETPRFTYGENSGGVGQGEGEIGDPIGPPKPQPGEGEAGEQTGEHGLEVDVDLKDLAEILGEALQLPRLKPKGQETLEVDKVQFNSISRQGSRGLKHFKRSFKQALLRQVTSGEYDPQKPTVFPIKDDMRYKSYTVEYRPEYSAVLFFMMDVSGSMTNTMKELVRLTSFWLNVWIKAHYKNLQTVFIIHDAEAQEVDEHTFFHTTTSGGTRLSSAYEMCADIIQKRFDPSLWNIYVFHFSDGDNWGSDNAPAMKHVHQLLEWVNLFSYVEVKKQGAPFWGQNSNSNTFYKEIDAVVAENVSVARLENEDGIQDTIKNLLQPKGLSK